MTAAGTTLEEMEPLLSEFEKCPAEIEKLEIFGFLATGRATEKSDLDVLVTFGLGAPLNYFGFILGLQEELEHQAGRKVDLVDRGSLRSDLFGYNATLQAKRIYDSDLDPKQARRLIDILSYARIGVELTNGFTIEWE